MHLTFLKARHALSLLPFAVYWATGFVSCHTTAPTPAPAVVTPECPKSVAAIPAPPVPPAPPPAPTCGLPLDLHQPEMPTRLPSTYAVEREPPPPGTVTLAVLPDAQYYSLCRYPHLKRQAEYIAAQQTSRNIVAAISLGDLTDRNSPEEWQFVRDSLAPVPQQLPLLLTTGNHDLGQNGISDSRESLIRTYFPESWAEQSTALRAVKEKGSIENAFYSLNTGKFRLGVLMLEWGPRLSTVKWANQVLTRFRDHRVVVITHAYLYDDGSRYDYATRPDQRWSPVEYRTNLGELGKDPSHDGEMLWNALVRRHPNVFLVMSGHVLGQGSGRMTSRGNAGNAVHQILVNYQILDEGGLGYLRLVELLPDGKSIHMKTYSPSLNLYSYATNQDFRLEIEPPLFKAELSAKLAR